MKLRLVRLYQFSGEKASVYTVLEETGSLTAFQRFINENIGEYQQNLLDIIRGIRSITNVVGLVEDYYRPDEGLSADDGVIALNDDPDEILRLYGIRISESLFILGGGGPKFTRTWNEDPKLRKEVELMMLVSRIVDIKMETGDLWVSENELTFCGNLDLF